MHLLVRLGIVVARCSFCLDIVENVRAHMQLREIPVLVTLDRFVDVLLIGFSYLLEAVNSI